MKESAYWDVAFPKLLKVFEEVVFENSSGSSHEEAQLRIGHSVTEWEVRSALCGDQAKEPGRSVWLRRVFNGGVSTSVPRYFDFCDTIEDPAKKSKFNTMISWMQSKFSGHVFLYDRGSIDNFLSLDAVWTKQLQRWKDEASSTLTDALNCIITRKKSWDEDGNGVGLTGDTLSEMLHHYSFARQRVSEFGGRSVALRQLLATITTPITTPKQHVHIDPLKPLAGIVSAYVCDVSGAGKSSIMAKLSSMVHDAFPIDPLQVLLRFCGTSSRSLRGQDLVHSLCQQMAFNICRGAERRGSSRLYPSGSDVLREGDRVLLAAGAAATHLALRDGLVGVVERRLPHGRVIVRIGGESEHVELKNIQRLSLPARLQLAGAGFDVDEEVSVLETASGAKMQRGHVLQDWSFIYEVEVANAPSLSMYTRKDLFSLDAALRPKPVVDQKRAMGETLQVGQLVALAEGYMRTSLIFTLTLTFAPGEIGKVTQYNSLMKVYTVQVVEGQSPGATGCCGRECLIPVEYPTKANKTPALDTTQPLSVGSIVVCNYSSSPSAHSDAYYVVRAMDAVAQKFSIESLSGGKAGSVIAVESATLLCAVNVDNFQSTLYSSIVGQPVMLSADFDDNLHCGGWGNDLSPGDVGLVLCGGKGGHARFDDLVYFRGIVVSGQNVGKLFCISREGLQALGKEVVGYWTINRMISVITTMPYDLASRLLQEMLALMPVVLLLDSLDGLSDEFSERSRLSFLVGCKPHPSTRVIVSCLPDTEAFYGTETTLKHSGIPRIHLSEATGEKIIADYTAILESLLQHQGRALQTRQWQRIVSLLPTTQVTGLYLHLASRIISSWSSSETTMTLSFQSVQTLFDQLMDTLGRNYGKLLVRAALGVVTFAVDGVSDEEMEDLLSMYDDVLDSVKQYCKSVERIPPHVWLRLRSELVGSLHLLLLARYFGNLVPAAVKALRGIASQPLYDYRQFVGRHVSDIAVWFPDTVSNERRSAEAAFQMLQGKMVSEAINEICSLSSVCVRTRTGRIYELLEDLTHLSEITQHINERVQHYLRWILRNASVLHQYRAPWIVMYTCSELPLQSVPRQDLHHLLSGSSRNLVTSELFASSRWWYRCTGCDGHQDFDATLQVFALPSEGWESPSVQCLVLIPGRVKMLVAGVSDGSMYIFDHSTGRTIKTWRAHSSSVVSVGTTCTGSLLVSAAARTLRLWEGTTGLAMATLDMMSDVSCVRCAPLDATVCVCTLQDGDLCLVTIESNKLQCFSITAAHKGTIQCLCISPDGSLLVSGSAQDCLVKVWTVLEPIESSAPLLSKEARVLAGHVKGLCNLQLTNTRQLSDARLAAASSDGSVVLWELASGKKLQEFHAPGALTSLTFTKDDSHLLAVCAPPQSPPKLLCWHVASGDSIADMSLDLPIVNALAVDLEGSKLMLGGSCVVALDLPSILQKGLMGASSEGTTQFDEQNHTNQVSCVAWSCDASMLASSSFDGTVLLFAWSTNGPQWRMKLSDHLSSVLSVTFHPQGQQLVGIDKDSVVMWSANDGKVAWSWNSPFSHLTAHVDASGGLAVTFHPAGRFLFVLMNDKLHILDVQEKKEVFVEEGAFPVVSRRVLRVDEKGDTLLALSKDTMQVLMFSLSVSSSSIAITSCREFSIDITPIPVFPGFLDDLDGLDGFPPPPLPSSSAGLWDCFFLPSSTRYILAFGSGGMILWEATTGEVVWSWDQAFEVEMAAVSPQGNVIAVRFLLGSFVRLFGYSFDTTGSFEVREVAELRLPRPVDVTALAFSPDGLKLLAGTTDGRVKVWDAVSLREEAS